MKKWAGHHLAVVIAVVLAVCLTLAWLSTIGGSTVPSQNVHPNGMAHGKPAEAERLPSETTPIDRAPADPPAIASNDPSTERIARSREQSGLGSLSDSELSSLLGLLAALEKSMADNRHGYVATGGSTSTVEYADLTFDVEGALAKANALLEGSYVLLPTGSVLDYAILGDPNLHVAVGPGGQRDGKSFQTHIIIDLRRHGRFAAALKNLAKLREKTK